MLRWKNCIAVVTGASAGIGAAIVKDLLSHEIVVVALARRIELIENYQTILPPEQKNNLHPVKCDVTNEQNVKDTFEWISRTLGGVDILINNAALLKFEFLTEMNCTDVSSILNTNVMGIVYCTKEAFKSMKNRNVNGHVILINSTAGHKVPDTSDELSVNIYPATKYCVTAMNEIYRQEFRKLKTNVKISSISPGAVDTNMLEELSIDKSVMLKPEDVSNAVMYVLGTPPNVSIHELVIKNIQEKY